MGSYSSYRIVYGRSFDGGGEERDPREREEHVSAWAGIVAGRTGSRIQISARLPGFPVIEPFSEAKRREPESCFFFFSEAPLIPKVTR